jgi:hypothetical protein
MAAVLREVRADRRLLATAVAVTAVFALLVAMPAVLIPNPFFQRMVPVRWWDMAVWAAAAPLVGVTFALSRRPACAAEGRATAGGLVAFLAVACPTCNALVVATLGVSGALTYFAPLQPVLGVAGVTLLLGVLRFQAARLDRTHAPPLAPGAEPQR